MISIFCSQSAFHVGRSTPAASVLAKDSNSLEAKVSEVRLPITPKRGVTRAVFFWILRHVRTSTTYLGRSTNMSCTCTAVVQHPAIRRWQESYKSSQKHNGMKLSTCYLVALVSVPMAGAFVAQPQNPRAEYLFRTKTSILFSEPSDTSGDTFTAPSGSAVEELDSCKADLVRMCTQSEKAPLDRIQDLVAELEMLGEQIGVGQASSNSGLLSGEWELLYSPEDVTRSSPFFWAFRKAFPDESDQIFGITDSIPAPVKEVGPAFQHIEMEVSNDGRSASGKFVSRVKVATLGGMATSIMTTRATINGIEGLDGIRLKIESTKPEESTVLKKLGPLGAFLNQNAPPFPSGDALERAAPGSSEVVMRTTYCDEGLRISRNEDRYSEPFVWRRKSFSGDAFEI